MSPCFCYLLATEKLLENITIDKVIYKASRIVYAMTTGEDIEDTDIGYLNGDYNDYSFANLMKKGG